MRKLLLTLNFLLWNAQVRIDWIPALQKIALLLFIGWILAAWQQCARRHHAA